MSRLLFAAARGARVQRQQEAINSNRTWWEDVAIQWGLDDELRIHPDDEHLQYGPVSSALREGAELPQPYLVMTFKSYLAIGGVSEYTTPYERTQGWVVAGTPGECSSELHRSLFLLILAEALAEDGL